MCDRVTDEPRGSDPDWVAFPKGQVPGRLNNVCFSVGDMLARVLACPFLRYPLIIHHLKEATLGFARG